MGEGERKRAWGRPGQSRVRRGKKGSKNASLKLAGKATESQSCSADFPRADCVWKMPTKWEYVSSFKLPKAGETWLSYKEVKNKTTSTEPDKAQALRGGGGTGPGVG